MSETSFYIGRSVENSTAGANAETVRYDPDDLTTHAIVVGMTGSGKTGLLINLLEEASLLGLPSIVIDPKGDLTNLLLHFPDQSPTDFEPWIDPESARRQSMTIPQMAADTARRWKEGLAGWELERDELVALRDAVDYVVYTPGSTAGEPVNLLASFAPPAGLNWQEHREILRERISSTVTALLGLIGYKDLDPLRSREHILLSNILETHWSKGAALDLTELILQAQNPPFERLGAFPVNSFFPEKDRLELALLLNNFLAAPSFQTWIEGASLDVDAFLYTPQRRPRMSIFYLAHLDETERMFFVTLLLAAVESWMRAQRGSPSLRALLAFDEIVGYLPPIANPPSRPVLLRLLKQARAFGLGLLLATQNPVDVDYKGLSNAGTWFIGRLQTERDKDRLLEGLQSIEGGIDSAAYAQIISGLRPRTFLLHNIHNHSGSRVFQTRWCLNYLAGPLTRVQIGDLKALGSGPELPPQPPSIANAIPPSTPASYPAPAPVQPASYAQPPLRSVQPAAVSPAAPINEQQSSRTVPAPPAGIQTLFVPPELSLSQALAKLGAFAGPAQPQGLLYRPGLLFQAEVSFYNRKYGLDSAKKVTCLALDASGLRIDWNQAAREPFDPRALDTQPLPDARFAPLPAWLSNARSFTVLQKDFLDWVYRGSSLRILANETLKVYSAPDESQASFRQKCDEAARAGYKDEAARIESAFNLKLSTLARRMERQQSIVDKYEDEVDRRRMEEVGTNTELILSIFSRRKRSLSNALSKGRMTTQARAELQQAEQALDAFQDEYKEMETQKDAQLKDLQDRWARAVGSISEIPITPLRKDLYLEVAGLAWLPIYLIAAGGQTLEAPAY
jgi:hypothetical protein